MPIDIAWFGLVSLDIAWLYNAAQGSSKQPSDRDSSVTRRQGTTRPMPQASWTLIKFDIGHIVFG